MNQSSKTMIRAQRLSKFYGAFVAIRDISFDIPEGQIVAFLGPNGAGKSTTLKILSGYLAPSEGAAAIAGINVHDQRQEAARRFGYLPENGPLYGEMTPRALLRFFGEIRGLGSDVLQTRMETVIETCGLHHVLEKPINKLSRGYRQRVGLAQALLHDPEVLIMDEPTAGLDPNQIREFRLNMKELAKEKTILLSTHILQEVEAVADRVILISEGRMVFDGAPDELKEEGSMEKPFYRLTNFGKSSSAAAASGV
jgi:ABC-2 type transport system ATP-binding protein